MPSLGVLPLTSKMPEKAAQFNVKTQQAGQRSFTRRPNPRDNTFGTSARYIPTFK